MWLYVYGCQPSSALADSVCPAANSARVFPSIQCNRGSRRLRYCSSACSRFGSQLLPVTVRGSTTCSNEHVVCPAAAVSDKTQGWEGTCPVVRSVNHLSIVIQPPEALPASAHLPPRLRARESARPRTARRAQLRPTQSANGRTWGPFAPQAL